MSTEGSEEAEREVTVRVSTPGAPEAIVFALAAEEIVLVGRDPEPARLAREALPHPWAVRAVSVAAVTVSGLHALVWREGGSVHVRDLRSRNGTFVAVASGGETALDVSDVADVRIELARPAPASAPEPRPRDAAWSSPEEYAPAVLVEVERWLSLAGVGLVARVVAKAHRDSVALPLGDGSLLELVEVETAGTASPLRDQLLGPLVEYLHDQAARLRAERALDHDADFVIASPVLWETHRRVTEASQRGLQLVLLGETGSGKGTLAGCYHRHSARRGGPFELVNCAEIDKHFARTRLFGARRGAYTGCHADVIGAVEVARGGTLFLDEVVELPLEVQGELLTFLDDQRYKRLGDDQWRQADVRVVCGTNVDLRRAVREGRFRADLWYRVAGRVVEVPPLRERPEDIAAYLKARALGEHPAAVTAHDALSPEALQLVLWGYPWRGNFRELEGFVRRLPLDAARGGVTAEVALAALAEGAIEGPATSAPGARAASWEAMVNVATSAWRRRANASEPMRAPEFREFVEESLKPHFFARALGLDDIDALPERSAQSFEEMARRMGCDASTVKNQLAKYIESRRAGRG